ncbi:MAG TPA: ATP-binding protein [Anaerolineae bacterium]|nr:ATP-binding protein [Anaerolineae bacterium]HNU03948.1 ATP-binding protein [Anaerolineae bacterium]
MPIKSTLKQGASSQTEYMPAPDSGRLAETLVAFANADGGTILLGVDESGAPVEGLFGEEMEEALRAALLECRPPIRTEWEQIETPGGAAAAIHVPRSTELHALADGRVLIRSGSQNRPLGGEQVRQLASGKSSGDFEMQEVAGAELGDLDPDIIRDYIAHREEKQGRQIKLPQERLLRQIGALTADQTPTVAGLLLFGFEPQFFLPQSGLTFVRFSGSELRGPGGLPGYTRRDEITGPLAQVIERTWAILLHEMRVEAVVKGLRREERTEYPPIAVREALVNAVCHRDYRLGGRRIEIRMFDDRLEVHSPGGLPGYITIDNIVDEHFSRNPRLVNGLYHWNYIEELGLGIDKMFDEMIKFGHPQPTLDATPHSFTVILQNVRQHDPLPGIANWETSMNERQLRALQYIKEHGRITSREYQDLCPNVTAETLRLDMVDLSDRSVVMKVGAKRGTYYILKQ